MHEKTHQPLLSTLALVVETVIHLRSQGHKVILVSSGAIGVGLKRMNIEHRPKSLSGKQVRISDCFTWDRMVTYAQILNRLWLPLARVDLLRFGIIFSDSSNSQLRRSCSPEAIYRM